MTCVEVILGPVHRRCSDNLERHDVLHPGGTWGTRSTRESRKCQEYEDLSYLFNGYTRYNTPSSNFLTVSSSLASVLDLNSCLFLFAIPNYQLQVKCYWHTRRLRLMLLQPPIKVEHVLFSSTSSVLYIAYKSSPTKSQHTLRYTNLRSHTQHDMSRTLNCHFLRN